MQNPPNTFVSFPSIKTIPEDHKHAVPRIQPAPSHRAVPDDPGHLSRRALLLGWPIVGATLALPFSYHGDVGFPAFEDGEGESHPILSLPFVRQSTDAERAAGAPPRRFWSVSPCGVHGTDCGTGARYAEAALDYIAREQSTNIFQWAVLDMIRQGRPHSGIEIGFLSVFSRLAADAWEARMTTKAGDLA